MNLNEEVRSGYTVSAEMKKVWKVQMDLLKKLLEVCDKHHLKIWAEGGTLLGTVREQGYIPWDDDIDMAMLRDDYDKLVRIAPEEFEPPYFFQCGYTEKIYPRGHAQLRMDGTSAISPASAYLNTHQGIFIDIFPFDAMPDDADERERLIQARNKQFNLLQYISSPDILHPFRTLKTMRLRPRFHEVFGHFENLFRKYSLEDCQNVACLTYTDDLEHFLRDKSWYDGTVYMPFEDIMMPVPSGYDQILTKQYGDYRTPVQAPTTHGGFWKLDTDHSYLEYKQELKSYCRKQDIRRKWRRIVKVFRRFVH